MSRFRTSRRRSVRALFRAMVCTWGLVAMVLGGWCLAQEVSNETFAVYELSHKTAAQVEQLLQPLLPQDESVRIIADQKKNQLLVSADAAIQARVREFLKTIDQPSEPVEPTIKRYRHPATTSERTAIKLRERFGRQGLKVSVEAESGSLYVMATPTIHLQVKEWLDRLEPTLENSVESKTTSADRVEGANPAQQVAATARMIPIPRATTQVVYDEVLRLFRDRLESDPLTENQFRLVTSSGRKLTVGFDEERSAFLVTGDEGLIQQFGTLVETLARRQFDRERPTQVLLLQREAQKEIEPLIPESKKGAQRSIPNSTTTVQTQPIGFQAGNLAGPQDLPVPSVPGQDDPTTPLPLSQFEGVEIDTLPDLDVIILRGRDQELQQLSDIIRQLEQISRENQAEIKIRPLIHVGSEQIAEIIAETQDDLVGSRQGRVTVTPLGKPNAIMLIGWGEALAGALDLAAKLDRPVDPNTQFEVFRLKHASAVGAEQTLQQFFAGRSALGVAVQTEVDARTNAIVVYASPRDMQEVRALLMRLDVPTSERVRQARVFPIENALAADVATTLEAAIAAASSSDTGAALELMTLSDDGQRLLRSGILSDVQVTINSRNNSLIITSEAGNFDLIQGLIDQLDTPGMIAKIKIFPVLNGDAASLVETLRSLLPSQVGNASQLQLGASPGETNLAPLRFTLDVRSNSIIATGSEGDLRIVEMLILRLDEGDSMNRKTSVYLLKNAPAADVALAVNEFLRNKRQVEEAGPGDINPFQQLEKEVVVVPEPVANKLILSATPRYFDEIEELIEQLDDQPPEVVIQVMIAEVALNDADEFGVELGIQDSVLFDRSLLGDLETTTNSNQLGTPSGILTTTQEVIQAATNLPGFGFNSIGDLGNSGSDRSVATADDIGGQGISNFSVGRANDQLGFGGLVLSASSQNLSVLVRALQEHRRIEILSRPQIRTLDNQPAFIQVGQRVPRITSSDVNVNGQTNQVVLENVGLILGVTPRISPEGTVVMEIDAEKSQLGPEAEGIPVSVSVDGTVIRSPRIDTTTAQATVSAADGETIILGGLITKSNQEIHRKVPVLGNVPVLKNLFRFDSVITRRTELLIILTPRVIRSREDSERLKQTEMARMHWCAADVYDIQGDINYMLDPVMMMPDEAKTEIIYPDQQPRGLEMPGSSSRRDQEWLQPVPPPSTDGSELVPPQSGEGASAIGTGVGFRTSPGETFDPRQVRRADWSDGVAREGYPVRQAVGGPWPSESSNPPYPPSSPESRTDSAFDPRTRFAPQTPPGIAR